MRILADENVSRLAVQSLQVVGPDVVAVKDVMPGATGRYWLTRRTRTVS